MALKQLIEKGFQFGTTIKELFIWSDGGLKTKENIFFFFRVACTFNISIFLNYFGPHHGHNDVDTHFGGGKRLLRFSARDGPILSANQIFEAFVALKKTVVKQIDVSETPFLVKPLKKQIRKWFEWYVSKEILCREQTGQLI